MTMLARIPFTLIFVTILIAANALAGTLDGTLPEDALERWGLSHLTVRDLDLYRLVTGTFLSHDLGMFLRQVVFAAAVIGAYEWLQGTRRAVMMFAAIDIAGSLIVLFVALPLLVALHPAFGAEELAVFDVGMSAGGFGLIGALLALQRYRWILLIAVCAAIVAKISVSFDLIADTAHLLCLFLGFAAQMALNGRAGKHDIAPT